MRMLTLLLLITLFCSATSCKKDDNNHPDCVKEENYFTAEFDGQTLEPYWSSGGYGIPTYSLGVYRNSNNVDDWHLYIGIDDPNIYIYIYMGKRYK